MAAYPSPKPQTPAVRDATLKASDALPNGAGTVNGTAIDLGPTNGISARTEFDELLLTAPALGTAALPDTTTVTYSVQASATSNFAAPVTLAGSVIVQTGAGGAGAAAASFRLKIPSNCPRYVRAVAVAANVGTGEAEVDVGNCDGSNMTLELTF